MAPFISGSCAKEARCGKEIEKEMNVKKNVNFTCYFVSLLICLFSFKQQIETHAFGLLVNPGE